MELVFGIGIGIWTAIGIGVGVGVVVGVGTLIAIPSNLPSISGSTSDTAFAAPVVVGIIDTAAARARRRSEWGKSNIL